MGTVRWVVAVVRSVVLLAFARCFFSFRSSCILRKMSVFGLCPLTVFLGLVVTMVEGSTYPKTSTIYEYYRQLRFSATRKKMISDRIRNVDQGEVENSNRSGDASIYI